MQKASGELLADVEVIVDGSVIDAPQQFILLQEPVMIKCEQITEVLDTAILPFQMEDVGVLRGPTLEDTEDITEGVSIHSYTST